MRAIDVLYAICTAVDKGDDPELILAEDSPLMEDAREMLKPKAPYEPPMLSRMDDLVDERNYLRNKVIALEESIERTFDDMAVLRQENAKLIAAQAWIPVSERLPTVEEYPDDTEIRGTWKSATGVMKSTEMLARHIREFPSHYLAWQPLPAPHTRAANGEE